MILTDELCDKLCAAAREKSKEIASISVLQFAMKTVYQEHTAGNGEALVLSITFVPGKAYTSAVTQYKTKMWRLLLQKALLWQFRQTTLNSHLWPADIRYL